MKTEAQVLARLDFLRRLLVVRTRERNDHTDLGDMSDLGAWRFRSDELRDQRRYIISQIEACEWFLCSG